MTVVLVVDDDPMIIKVVSSGLEKSGYDAVAATDGVQALEITMKMRPDIIILDEMMPKLSGFDTLMKLKTDSVTANIPVIMLTARRTQSDILTARSAGANSYIAKPFSIGDLISRINKTLNIK